MDVPVTMPVTVLIAALTEGAIVELYDADGHLHAEIRIPAPQE